MCLYPIDLSNPGYDPATENYYQKSDLLVPCGRCIECLEAYSKEWSFRIADEASLYEQNCMLLLTYSVTDGNVNRLDVQLFFKRLRKALDTQKVRYFYCGEYGSKGKRPHYHIIIFGWIPDDLIFWKYTKRGQKVYRSAFLQRVWESEKVYDKDGNFLYYKAWNGKPRQPGFVSVGTKIDIKSAKYSAKYLQKLAPLLPGKVPPFTGMSNRPGIGYRCITEKVIESDKIYQGGYYIKTPRYYLKKLSERGFDLTDLKSKRIANARRFVRTAEQYAEARSNARHLLE